MVYTKGYVGLVHIWRDISSCYYWKMQGWRYPRIDPFFVSFSSLQIDSYLLRSSAGTFACVFDAQHEPSRSIWLVLLDLVRATRIKGRKMK